MMKGKCWFPAFRSSCCSLLLAALLSFPIIFSQRSTRANLGKKGKSDDVDSSSITVGIVAGVIVAVIILLLLIATLFIYRRRKPR